VTLVASVWADADPANRTGDPEKLGRVHSRPCARGGAEAVRAGAGDAALVFFPETVKAFTAIPDTDPSWAIAYWGIDHQPAPNRW